MRCPRCAHAETAIIKTERIEEAGFVSLVKRRRRRCLRGDRGRVCEGTFLTYEIHKEDYDLLLAIKNGDSNFVPTGMIRTIEEASAGKLKVVPKRKARS